MKFAFQAAMLVLAGALFATPARAQTDGPPAFLLTWGSYGIGNGQFDVPNGIAVDASGNVYVTDRDNHRIQRFTSDGAYLTQWGSLGSGNGQFGDPAGVAIGPGDTVFVADCLNNRIQLFTGDGAYLSQWGLGYCPQGVAIDAAGNVYLTNQIATRIEKFTSAGTFLTQWGSFGSGNGQFNGLRHVAVDRAGNVYVPDPNNYRVQKFTSDGTYLSQWGSYGSGSGQFRSPNGIAVDNSGNVYVADGVDGQNHRIQKFTSDGAFLTQWGSYGSGDGQFILPTEVTTDATANVYVVDLGNNLGVGGNPRVEKFGCPGGGGPGGCVALALGGQLFGARYTSDASSIPDPPGVPVYYDSAMVTLTKTQGDVFFISGRPDTLADWIADDHLYVEATAAGDGFAGVIDPSLPTCVPIERNLAAEPARDITALIADGTNCVKFRLGDTQRGVFGNTAIYLVKSSTVGVAGERRVPASVAMQPLRPNPSPSSVEIEFELPSLVRTRMDVVDIAGRVVRRLIQGQALAAGPHLLHWDGRDDLGRSAPVGIYSVRIIAGEETTTRKIALVH